jgi:hypothetical protein
MAGHEEETAILADAYIDALLARPRLFALPAAAADLAADPVPGQLDGRVRQAAEIIVQLPRFHPSFAFEESLALRLRELAAAPSGRLAEVIAFPGAIRDAALRQAAPGALDRRLLLGGAIVGGALASGVSFAAIYAWRSATRRNARHEVVA